MESVEKEVVEIIAGVLKKKPEAISPEAMMGDVEEWDSLANVLIVSEVERHFAVVFDVGQVADAESVQDLIDLVRQAKTTA